jgi:hypothetical protein
MLLVRVAPGEQLVADGDWWDLPLDADGPSNADG